MGDTFDVIMAAYPVTEAAERDFDALVHRVRDKAVRSEGVILVEHDAEGRVQVSQTGDHLGRRGLGWGGGVGLVVGLFAPPLLASVAVGAAAGGLIGSFARHRVDSGIEDNLGDKLRPGTAVIIAVVDDDDLLAAEQALAGSPAKSVAAMSRNNLAELKAALAEAAGKFSPDRTVLPIPDRAFGGTTGRTIDQSVADWSMIPGPQPPEDAPNVLIVLIDDAGYGNPGLWADGEGMLHHTYSYLGVETYKQVSTEKLPAGDVTVKMLFAADETKPGTGGIVTLWANGKVIGEGKMPHTVPLAFSSYAGMDIGRDNGLVVDLAYEDKAPYPFTGTVKKVVFDLKPTAHEDEKALHEHAQIHGIGEGAAG